MRTLKYIDDFLENDKLENIINNRDSKIEDLIKYKDCIQYDIFGYVFYINEKLGYNDILKQTTGKTKEFLILYYMTFKDELNSNIQMFHSQIGKNNIKTKEQFLKFLNNSKLYNVAIKMKNIDILKYWMEICKEGYGKVLIKELGIDNLNSFLKETSDFIIKSGNIYIHKMSKSFL